MYQPWTRLLSSRMHTARSLTVSPSMLCSGGGGCACLVLGGLYPSMHWGTPPPHVNRITDACENITLPQLVTGGKNGWMNQAYDWVISVMPCTFLGSGVMWWLTFTWPSIKQWLSSKQSTKENIPDGPSIWYGCKEQHSLMTTVFCKIMDVPCWKNILLNQ